MKNRILTYIIGILTGFILSATVFLIYSKTINNMRQYENMPVNQNKQRMPANWNMEEPPVKPEDMKTLATE